MTTIKLKNGSGAPTSGDLAQGEPALDLTNKRLYTEDSGGTVIEVGTNPTSITTGAITSTGVDVTGTVTSDGLRVDGTPVRFVSTAPMLNFMESGVTDSNHRLRQNAGNFVIQKLSDDEGTATDRIAIDGGTGDISLYSGVVQIGPSGSTGDRELRFETGSGSASGEDAIINSYRSNADLILKTNDTDRMRIDASGNVGIGTSSPFFTASGRVSLSLNGSNSSILAFGKNGSSENYILADAGGFTIANTSATLPTIFFNNGTERMRINSSGNLLVGTTTTSRTTAGHELHANGFARHTANNDKCLEIVRTNGDGEMVEFFQDTTLSGQINTRSGQLSIGVSDTGLEFNEANDNVLPVSLTANGGRDAAIDLGSDGARFKDLYLSGTVGIGSGTAYSPLSILNGTDISMNAGAAGQFNITGNGYGFGIALDATGAHLYTNSDVRSLIFGVNETERMRIDGSGNLLIGKSSTSVAVAGCRLGSFGAILTRGDGSEPLRVNRTSSDGEIIKLDKDGTTVGSIGTASSRIYIGTSDTGLGFSAPSDAVFPVDASDGSQRDNAIDLGVDTARFDDIYATNGTIQTSDRNEKQDIEALSDAEQRVAVAAKGLLRKFRWIDSVEEKGDEARIHFGIIAQDLQDAFTAEGLDAGRYAMFISTTWTDEETSEERTRMGVRYSELLAFIIAAI
jgi:hypothetical protein